VRIKSYFADTVQEAIEKARVELGPDAMLMNSKKTDFELRALGAVEVVFGLPGQTKASKPRLQPARPPGPALQAQLPAQVASAKPALSAGASTSSVLDERLAASAATDGLPVPSAEVAHELAELRRQIETVKRSVSRQQRSTSNPDEKPSRAVENLCARLMAADISEDLAQELAEAVELQAFAWKQPPAARGLDMFPAEASAGSPAEMMELALLAELDRRFQVAPELGRAGVKQKIVLFAGPAGAGKTTSLIKLGLRCGLQARLPMHILSLDTLRVGGWEHLAAYCRIAGLGFDPVHNLSSLQPLLAQHADKKLILIDTPGFGPSDSEDLNDLAGWLRQPNSIDVQLVVPATLRPSVFNRTVERFAPLKPAKLLLTRADETESSGILLDLAMRSGLPLSYIGNGQTIPEDIEQPSKAALLACLCDRKPSRITQEAA
jgi:flagellar biosynthesis protein FlhF